MIEYHDAETLEMARAVTTSSTAAVQCALNDFWGRYGKPSPQVVEVLRERVTAATRQALAAFFGEAVEGSEEQK